MRKVAMAAAIRLDDHEDFIDICMDNVFKAVFTKDTPASRSALSRLVSAIIGRDVEILTIDTAEPPIDNLRDRQIRFDITCKTGDGERWSSTLGSCLPARTSRARRKPTTTCNGRIK